MAQCNFCGHSDHGGGCAVLTNSQPCQCSHGDATSGGSAGKTGAMCRFCSHAGHTKRCTVVINATTGHACTCMPNK